MADVFEFLVGIFAVFIYGTKNRPKHALWRNTLRIVAFGGSLVAALILSNILGEIDIPNWLILVWFFCLITVMCAEYYVGKPSLSLVTFIIGVCLLGWAIFHQSSAQISQLHYTFA